MPMLYSNKAVKKSVAALYQTDTRVYLACTGAGAGVTDLFWQVEGTSRALMMQSFPYQDTATDLFIDSDWGGTGHSYCGMEAAVALAQKAYFLCMQIAAMKGDVKSTIMGLGLTAAVSTDRTLRGGTRCYAALRTATGIKTVEVWLDQGYLGRKGDGQVCNLIGLNLVLEASGMKQVPLKKGLHLTSTNTIDVRGGVILKSSPYPDPVLPDDLSSGVLVSVDGKVQPIEEADFNGKLIFPGSYWPVTFAHDNLGLTVERFAEKQVIYEITKHNADKAAFNNAELSKRASQFAQRWPVVLCSGASRFIDKVKQYPGMAGFVVGADTAARLLDPKYYGGAAGLREMLQEFIRLGIRFYVFDRAMEDGNVLTCDKFKVAKKYRELFIRVSGRWDISSSAIRKAKGETV